VSRAREDVRSIPYWPRPLQAAVSKGMSSCRFGVLVCHRRFGKTVLAINLLQKAALMCTLDRPRFAYIAPTYRQGKASAWDYMQHYAKAARAKIHQAELRVDYENGAQVRIFGADNPDSMRGIYLDGVVFDEFGMQPPRVFSEVIRPTLADRHGWALFMGTPAGKNEFYAQAQKARTNTDWFYAEHKASETGILPDEELAASAGDMTADEYAQEYECSFEASVKGAIFSAELLAAVADGRVTQVPYDPALPVDTDWDLGIGDAMSIWFSQSTRSGEVRLIDYYENSGEGLPHYVTVLSDRGYTYGEHWAPHDIRVRELGTGKSRLETARGLGLDFKVGRNLKLEEGIHAARLFFRRCWFDEVHTRVGRESLQHYRRDYNTRLQEFTATPVHDWASHGADAFRGLAVRHKTPEPDEFVLPPYVSSGVWQ
jgi:phage terminase large subunit